MTTPGSDFGEVLTVALTEVQRQEGRIDVKAEHIAGLAATLATMALGGATVISAVAPHPLTELIWAVVPLFITGLCWAATTAVLLREIIRPRLDSNTRTTFTHPRHVEHLKDMTPTAYREKLVSGLGALVLRRYRAILLAVDLLVAGFGPLLLAGIAAGTIAILTHT